MADWGDIAAGVNQGMAQNVKTVSMVMQQQRENEYLQMEKNKNDYMMKELAEKQKPIYLDRVLDKFTSSEEKEIARKHLASSGLINDIDSKNPYIRKGDREAVQQAFSTPQAQLDFAQAKLNSSMKQEESIQSKIKELSSSKDENGNLIPDPLKVKTKEQDIAILKSQLAEAAQTTDALKYSLPHYKEKAQIDVANRKAAAAETGNLIKLLNAGDKSQTEEQLTARALKGDKDAQGILDAMQKRKVDIAKNTKAATVNIQAAGQNAPAGSETWDRAAIAKKLGYNEKALTFNLLRKIDDPAYNPFGRYRGQSGQRILFDNAFGKMMEEAGLDPKQVMMASKDVKADTKAYLTLKPDYERTMQAVEMTKQYATLVHERNDTYQRSNYPAPNRFWNWAQKNLSSEDRAQFEMSLLAFSREYMRVTTGASRSVAELSVGAQAKVDDILSKFDSWSVLNAKVSQAEREIGAVEKSYDKRFSAIKKRMDAAYGMTGGGGGTPPSSENRPSLDSFMRK